MNFFGLELPITLDRTEQLAEEILKNYRNSKEILEAAYNIYKHNLDENSEYSSPSDKSLMIQSPEYADYSYNKPLICSAKSLNEELTYGFHYIQDALNGNSGQIGCLAVSGVQLNQLEKLETKIATFKCLSIAWLLCLVLNNLI